MLSPTPENTASLMSMTNRGGSLIGKVVKLGFREPEISTVPPFTCTFLMVLSWTLSWARAAADRERASPSTAIRTWVTGRMLPEGTPAVQRTPGRTRTYSAYVCSRCGRARAPSRRVRAYSMRFLMS